MSLYTKEFFIPVEKSLLFCRQYGVEGAPTVVVHGGPGLGSSYLLPQMGHLGQFTKAYFYDQRGTGQSQAHDDWYDNPIQTYIKDLEQLRHALAFEKINLIAHSWGSILASFYTLQYPQHVNKLIYLNPVPISSALYLEYVHSRTQIIEENKEKLDPIRQTQAFIDGDPEMVIKYYRLYFRCFFSDPKLVDKLSLSFTQQSALANFKIFSMFFSYVQSHPFDLYPKMNSLNKPALIIAGNKDVIPMHYINYLHQHIPQGQVQIIKNCGHFPYIEQPVQLLNILRQYI